MKKFLSMVLALAMAMSLVTFAAPAAGAKNFTDDGSIQYKEAVDVISAIQIMDGYADASFNPSGTLTRGAAAKIICNMILGPTTASALPTNVAPYPDVAAGSTFAGYIAYCSEHQIISGYADGNFRPADSLSGYAFLKMLLCALGYDQEIEGYKGANWRVNVAKQALGIGLDDGLTVELDGSRIVTREEAALYAFNTLQADMVEYDSRTTVSVNGATITTGGNTYHSKTSTTQSTENDHIDDRALDVAGIQSIVQFAEEYFPQLIRIPAKNRDFRGGQDSFGRPSTTWRWKGVEVGTYEVRPAKVYYDDVAVNTIYNDLNLAGTSLNAVVYLNGELLFEMNVERSNGDKIHEQDAADLRQGVFTAASYGYTIPGALARYTDKVGKGTMVEVFHEDDTNRMVICAISVYPGQVTEVKGRTASKDPCVVIEYQRGADGFGVGTFAQVANSFTRNGHNEFETTAFHEDDMVWFTYSNEEDEIGEVHLMESVEGKLDRRTNDGVQIEGVFYDYAKEHRLDVTKDTAGLANGSSYIVYKDENGNLLWLEESTFAADKYALIERIYVENQAGTGMFESSLVAGVPTPGANANWNTSRVRLLLANGTERTVDLDESKRYRNNTNTGVNANYQAGEIVRFVDNGDGTYRLYTVSGNGVNTVNSLTSVTNFSIVNHVMDGIYKNGHDDDNAYVVRGDSDTIFVVKDTDTTRAYTGIRNSPTVASDGTAVAYAYVTGNGDHQTARLIFVVRGSISNVSKDIIFLAGKSKGGQYMSDENDPYYEYSAVVKGVILDEPLYIKADVNNSVGMAGILLGPKVSAPGNDGDAPNADVHSDAWTGSIILNDVTYDSNDFITEAQYSATNGVQSRMAQGIKRTSRDDEVRLDTFTNDDHVEPLSSSCNIYFVDDDGVISRISVGDIVNDNDNIIYYTFDDGDITNMFICDYEEKAAYFTAGTITGAVITLTWNDDASAAAKANWNAKSNSAKMADIRDALNQQTNVRSVTFSGGNFDGDNARITVTLTNGTTTTVTRPNNITNEALWYNVTNP